MKTEEKFELPENWRIDIQEISPYQFRVLAIAADGRRIEMIGSDEDQLTREVRASIEEFEAQPKYRKTRTEREA